MHIIFSLINKSHVLFLIAIAVIVGVISLTIVGGKSNIKELNISVFEGFKYNLKK